MPNEPPTSLVSTRTCVLGQAEMLGEQVLHHVRRLRAVIDGQALLAGVPVGDQRARLGGDAGVAAEHEGGLDHRVGVGEGLVDLADFELALEAEIVAERRRGSPASWHRARFPDR